VPWVEVALRGQKVLARADAAGELVSEGGRVEIRYKPKDGKSYRASRGNLEKISGGAILPDDHCAEAAAAPTPTEQKAAKKAASAARVEPPRPGETVVFTDGACSGNPGPAGAGFLVVDPTTGKIREGCEYLGTATNNVAELTAILRGVEAVADVTAPIRVHTDSSYAIGVLQKGWKAKANPELIARIRAELAKRPNTLLVYVPGHAGVPLNERADGLAHESLTQLHVVTGMHPRKAMMADLSDAFIALPGGFGTFEELFEVTTWGMLAIHRKPIGLLDTAGFHVPLMAMVEHATREGFIEPAHAALLVSRPEPAPLLDALAARAAVDDGVSDPNAPPR